MSEEASHGPPPEGLECMVTMEDITLEDGNYGESHNIFHECLLCVAARFLSFIRCGVTAEYQCFPSMVWKPALFETSVLEKLRMEQFHTFVDRVKTTDCQAELRRLLSAGPPIYVSDDHGLPLHGESDTHIVKLWYSNDGKERPAKLHGALEGDERQQLWDELKKFIIVEGKEEGDDDEGESKKK